MTDHTSSDETEEPTTVDSGSTHKVVETSLFEEGGT